jgi:hypothetical protein
MSIGALFLLAFLVWVVRNRQISRQWPDPAGFALWVDYHHAVAAIEGQRFFKRHWEMRALGRWNAYRARAGLPTDLYHLIPRSQKWTDEEIANGDWPC